MKAYVLEKIGEINYKDVETPDIKDDEVLVNVMAAGICGSDIPRIYKTGAHVHPIVPGHEFSGEVEKCGENAKEWAGKRVGIFPLIPCMECKCCKKKQYEMCRNYSYLGSRCDGGFAECVRIPKWNLIELPKNVSFRTAAMLEPMAVAAHAVRRVIKGLDKDAYVAVWGLGTIGLMSILLFKAEGFDNIIAIGKKESQRVLAVEFGVKESNYIDGVKEQVSEKVVTLTNGYGAEAVLECAGRNETYEGCIDIAAPGGRVMLVGNPASDMELSKKVYWKILRHELTVFGTWNSSFTHEENDDWNYVLKLFGEDKIDANLLISHSISFDELEKGLLVMRDKKEDYIKIMIER